MSEKTKLKLPTYSPDQLLKPLPTTTQKDRKAWGIGLNSTWLPFFMAMNVTGQANVPAEALGAPLRLATEKDGTPRFNKAGMPVLRVVKELTEQVRITRENIDLHLQRTAQAVQAQLPKEYAAEVQRCQAAGKPLIAKDAMTVQNYLDEIEAVRQAMEEKATAPSTPTPADKELVPVG